MTEHAPSDQLSFLTAYSCCLCQSTEVIDSPTARTRPEAHVCPRCAAPLTLRGPGTCVPFTPEALALFMADLIIGPDPLPSA